MTKPSFVETAMQRIPVGADLRRAPRQRVEKKIKSSFLGIVAALFGLAVMAFAGVLIIVVKPMPHWTILAGTAGVGFVMFAYGCLQVDPETAGPALTTLVTLGKQVRGDK